MTERVRIERMATGGDGVGRLSSGSVVFVRGVLAGELVDLAVVEQKKRFARAQLVQIVEPSPARAPLVCDHAERQCGGCDWMHFGPEAQRGTKVQLVEEQLERLGGIASPVVSHSHGRPGRRITVRCTITGGRAGFRARRSREGFTASSCQAAHPLVEELIVDGRFGGAGEVSIRVAPSTGERLVWVHDWTADERVIEVPDDVIVTDRPDGAELHHDIGGHRIRVSAGSFFQTSDAGTNELIETVVWALMGSAGRVVDLYGGVGLLGATAAGDRLGASVESHALACADARQNLGKAVDVVTQRVERWRPESDYPTVIADPPRSGLGADGVATVEACRAERLVLVSCDPAALGRDAGLLRAAGWSIRETRVVDMFPDTSRIEAVTRFDR